MKTLKKLLIFVLAAVPILLIIHIFIRTTLLEKQVVTSDGFRYTNHKLAYSVDLSKDWKRRNMLVSQVIWLNSIIEFENKNLNLESQIVWYDFNERDFYEGERNLMDLVQDDTEYAKQYQSTETDSVRDVINTNNRWIILWSGHDNSSNFIRYYIFDKSDPKNTMVHVLHFSSKTHFTDAQKEEVKKVLKGFNLINTM